MKVCESARDTNLAMKWPMRNVLMERRITVKPSSRSVDGIFWVDRTLQMVGGRFKKALGSVKL